MKRHRHARAVDAEGAGRLGVRVGGVGVDGLSAPGARATEGAPLAGAGAGRRGAGRSRSWRRGGGGVEGAGQLDDLVGHDLGHGRVGGQAGLLARRHGGRDRVDEWCRSGRCGHLVALRSPRIGAWRLWTTDDRLVIMAREAGNWGTWSFNITITLWVTLVDRAAAWAALSVPWPMPDDPVAGAAETADDVNGPATRRRATAPVTHAIVDFRTGCPSLHRSHRRRIKPNWSVAEHDRRPPPRHVSCGPWYPLSRSCKRKPRTT